MANEHDVPEKIITVYELNKINEELEDPEVTEVLVRLSKIIAKPNIPLNHALPLIVELEGYAFSFQLKSKYYMLIGKSQPNSAMKKNLYATLAKSTADLVAAVKYVTKG